MFKNKTLIIFFFLLFKIKYSRDFKDFYSKHYNYYRITKILEKKNEYVEDLDNLVIIRNFRFLLYNNGKLKVWNKNNDNIKYYSNYKLNFTRFYTLFSKDGSTKIFYNLKEEFDFDKLIEINSDINKIKGFGRSLIINNEWYKINDFKNPIKLKKIIYNEYNENNILAILKEKDLKYNNNIVIYDSNIKIKKRFSIIGDIIDYFFYENKYYFIKKISNINLKTNYEISIYNEKDQKLPIHNLIKISEKYISFLKGNILIINNQYLNLKNLNNKKIELINYAKSFTEINLINELVEIKDNKNKKLFKIDKEKIELFSDNYEISNFRVSRFDYSSNFLINCVVKKIKNEKKIKIHYSNFFYDKIINLTDENDEFKIINNFLIILNKTINEDTSKNKKKYNFKFMIYDIQNNYSNILINYEDNLDTNLSNTYLYKNLFIQNNKIIFIEPKTEMNINNFKLKKDYSANINIDLNKMNSKLEIIFKKRNYQEEIKKVNETSKVKLINKEENLKKLENENKSLIKIYKIMKDNNKLLKRKNYKMISENNWLGTKNKNFKSSVEYTKSYYTKLNDDLNKKKEILENKNTELNEINYSLKNKYSKLEKNLLSEKNDVKNLKLENELLIKKVPESYLIILLSSSIYLFLSILFLIFYAIKLKRKNKKIILENQNN